MKEFFKQLFSANDSDSSKRVMAFIAFPACIFLAFFKYDNQTIMYILGFVTVMMGLGTVDNFSQKG
jgi:hypothetical protein